MCGYLTISIQQETDNAHIGPLEENSPDLNKVKGFHFWTSFFCPTLEMGAFDLGNMSEL